MHKLRHLQLATSLKRLSCGCRLQLPEILSKMSASHEVVGLVALWSQTPFCIPVKVELHFHSSTQTGLPFSRRRGYLRASLVLSDIKPGYFENERSCQLRRYIFLPFRGIRINVYTVSYVSVLQMDPSEHQLKGKCAARRQGDRAMSRGLCGTQI